MFYRPSEGHGLPHNPFNALIVPRPIAWVSSRSADGHDNLAPYSFFNGVAYEPPQVMFASTGDKDSLKNIRETQVFCVNMVDFKSRDAMNITAAHFPHNVDEFDKAGVEKAEAKEINCAYVAAAPATMECRVTQLVELKGGNNTVVFGEVIGIHLRDDCLVDGKFDATTFTPLARMGYLDYAAVNDVFTMKRPDE